MLVALASLPAGAMAEGSPVDAHAQMRAAMNGWLATPWDDARETALQAHAPPAERKALLHLSGSPRAYSLEQMASSVPDWWPQDHPPMPRIVATGRGKAIPCAECHLPNGVGSPHTASLQGLPAAYILAQVYAFRDGSRANDEMHAEAAAVGAADLQAAVTYFSGLHLMSARARVIETARVPGTRIESWMLVPAKGAGSEAIGERVIELPVNVAHLKMGDARSRFVAYVPAGSLARGKLLASTGAGVTTACMACHGRDLRGVSSIPPLAGRSPTYITRQLVQFALGGRRGPAALPMQQEVSRLTLHDMISAAAYAGSLKP